MRQLEWKSKDENLGEESINDQQHSDFNSASCLLLSERKEGISVTDSGESEVELKNNTLKQNESCEVEMVEWKVDFLLNNSIVS